jgi:hypothetical protein
MFGWLRKRAERKAFVQAEAERLIQENGGQVRFMLADQIREMEAKGQDTKEVWRVLREVRKLSGDEGLDTGTRFSEDR